MTTLKITVESDEAFHEDVRERIEALERGDAVSQRKLSFESTDDLYRLLRPTNLELLRVIAKHDPESIRQTADLVDRDVKNVHDNLTDLAEMGILSFEEAGRSKRPVVTFERIEVDIPLPDAGPESDASSSVSA